MALKIEDKLKQPDASVNNRVGTGFTNLNRIMQANQTARLGQKVGTQLGQQTQQVGQKVQQAGQQFGQKSQETIGARQNQAQQARGTLQNIGNIQQQNYAQEGYSTVAKPVQSTQQMAQVQSTAQPLDVTQIGAGPSQSFQIGDTEKNLFKDVLSGEYAGPQQLENIDVLRGLSQQNTEVGRLLGSGAYSQAEALKQLIANPVQQYTRGQSKLDVAALGADKANAAQLTQARRQALQTFGNTEKQARTAEGVFNQNKAMAALLGEQVGKETEQLGDIYKSEAQRRAKTARESDIALRNRLQDEARRLGETGEISRELAQKLGLDEGARTYGVNLGQFLKYEGMNPDTGEYDASQMLSQDEANRFSALRGLLGKQAELDVSKAGQYRGAGIAADVEAARAAIDTAAAPVKKAQQGVEAAQSILRMSKGQLNANEMAEAREFANTPEGQNILRMFGPNIIGQPGMSAENATPQALGQVLWYKRHGHGGGNAPVVRADWAEANLANATKNLDALNAQYGGSIKIR